MSLPVQECSALDSDSWSALVAPLLVEFFRGEVDDAELRRRAAMGGLEAVLALSMTKRCWAAAAIAFWVQRIARRQG